MHVVTDNYLERILKEMFITLGTKEFPSLRTCWESIHQLECTQKLNT